MREPPYRLADHVADELVRASADLTMRWLDRIAARLGVRPRRVFPTALLRDHIPAVIEDTANQLRSPEPFRASDRLVRRLRDLAHHRRERGYDVLEVLSEFAWLGDVVFEAFADAVASYPGEADSVGAARLAIRVYDGMASIGTITAGIYSEEEVVQTHELSRRVSQYARTVAHELKTPLGAAESAADMLAGEEIVSTPEQRRHFSELVRRNLRRARELIDDIHTLAVAEVGEAAIHRRERLPVLIREVLTEVHRPAEEAGVEIRVDEPVPDIEVDATRVEIALMNLVGNAIKYADPEKPRRWVRIAAERAGDARWRVSVADNGLGIPDRLHDRVFQRFFRAHPGATGGTGLGLSIAREAVYQLGGEIGFESEEGVGSTFGFTFGELGQEAPPAAPATEEPTARS